MGFFEKIRKLNRAKYKSNQCVKKLEHRVIRTVPNREFLDILDSKNSSLTSLSQRGEVHLKILFLNGYLIQYLRQIIHR